MLLNQGHSCFYSNFKCREIKSANKLFFWWNRIQIRNLLITYHQLWKKPAIFNLRKNCRKFVLFHHSLKCSTRKFEFNWNLRKNRHFSTVLFQSVNNHKLIGFRLDSISIFLLSLSLSLSLSLIFEIWFLIFFPSMRFGTYFLSG